MHLAYVKKQQVFVTYLALLVRCSERENGGGISWGKKHRILHTHTYTYTNIHTHTHTWRTLNKEGRREEGACLCVRVCVCGKKIFQFSYLLYHSLLPIRLLPVPLPGPSLSHTLVLLLLWREVGSHSLKFSGLTLSLFFNGSSIRRQKYARFTKKIIFLFVLRRCSEVNLFVLLKVKLVQTSIFFST